MLDKALIKNNFKKSIKTYNNNAFVQKHTSEYIINLIKNYKFDSILEIGSYTGILTEKTVGLNPNFKKYIAVDIIEDSVYNVKRISSKIDFILSDIEDFETKDKFDLITSNASLQWCNDFMQIFTKLKTFLNKDGIIAVSVFKEGNLYEIKEAFDVMLNYPDDNYLLNMQKNGILAKGAKIESENIKLKFNSSLDILKHLKHTGVNSLNKNISISKLKKGLKILEEEFNNEITYKPLYIIDKL